MTTKRGSVTVRLEVDPSATEGAFTSDAMKACLEANAERLARDKSNAAKSHLHGQVPQNGMFSYRMKLGEHTWMAIIHPNNRAAYAIGRKYGIDNL